LPAPQEEADWEDGEGRSLADYALQPEDAQPFDPAHLPRTHRVTGDESLYDIAERYQVPLRALIDQNNLEPPYALASGRELRLPPPRFHRVARGEDFDDVARRYNIDPRSLGLLNRMQPPYNVRAGDRIVLPATARAAPDPALAPTIADRSPPPAGNARFRRPLAGEVVARFGAQPGGGYLDGVEIAGRAGDGIVAAAEGDVVYVGTDLDAYGTLVLVRHADNYVTAYAYAQSARVREGQHVRAGETIAELGRRPDGRARLLFQVRQGAGAAIDPAPLLGVGNRE
jgi:murein DD-endopeptidase MepM/ murein hydrolase activator NlpD